MKLLFIRKLYLIKVMLLDLLIKLRRSIYQCTSQNCLFPRDSQNVGGIICSMYPSKFRQFNVCKVAEEPGRSYLFTTLELLTFIWKLLIFM